MKHDFLSITDMTSWQIRALLAEAERLKAEYASFGQNPSVLSGKSLIMIFEKPSLRTHASFDIGMTQLGGRALYFGPDQIRLGKRESVSDAAHVLSRMGDCIMARVFDHDTLMTLAAHSSVPVINGLSDLEHPCQMLADLLTIQEHKGSLKGLRLAFVGDGENNVTHSLLLGAALMGMHCVVASPKGYMPKAEIVAKATSMAEVSLGSIAVMHDPKAAVVDADIVYTDTWVSMGEEKHKAKRRKDLAAYQVMTSLMRLAKSDAIFMHDMPAHIGQEVTSEVYESAQSVVFDQAENRLHAQKALLLYLLSGTMR